jgi:carboxypeptidase D
MAFLSELAANASAHDVEMIFYSGNDDMLVAHRGTEGQSSLRAILVDWVK